MELILLLLAIVSLVLAFMFIGTIANIAIFLLSGLIIGAIARLLVPGTGSMGLLQTMAAGVLGSVSGGMIAHAMDLGRVLELVMAVIVAAVLVMVFRPKAD